MYVETSYTETFMDTMVPGFYLRKNRHRYNFNKKV